MGYIILMLTNYFHDLAVAVLATNVVMIHIVGRFLDEEPGRAKLEKIAGLRPAFQKSVTITAANASKINDGAAALVLASGEAVKKHGLKPMYYHGMLKGLI